MNRGPEWTGRIERADPEAADVEPDRLADAVVYAKTHDTPAHQVRYDFSDDAWAEAEGEHGGRIGPMPDRRGGPAGVVLHEGRVVAEWGDTTRVDHAFSVAKSFLSICAGVAYDRGLIADVSDLAADYVADLDDSAVGGTFEGDHNGAIRWEHLLQQTSEWEGTLFGKPDSVDRNRAVGKETEAEKGAHRDLREPGTFWEYNDVRINRLALALLRVHGKPLPRVLAHEVMEPAGATRTWEWHGYHNSDVLVDGTRMRSVSGGGHWGGGFWGSARDLARAGQLLANRGQWGEKQLLSEEWVQMATAPCGVQPTYGYLFWLNTDRALWPSAPASCFAMLGHGRNVVWVNPEDDLVAVLRWLRSPEEGEFADDDRYGGDSRAMPIQDGFYRRLLDAVG